MTFPVRAATNTTVTAGVTTHTVNLPASISAGDQLLLTCYNINDATLTTPTGWNLLTSVNFAYWFERLADGGEGATVDITASGLSSMISISERWTGASGNIEASAAVATLDPSSLTPSWGAKDTAWVTSLASFIGLSGDDDSVPPTNYGNPVERAIGFNGVMTAYRELNAASEDPGSWTQPEGNGKTALVAIEPATTVSAALSGTITSSANETTIRTGGATIILTLTGDTWVAAGAAFNAQRQAIINDIDSAQAEAAGWDATVKALQSVAGVVRTSDTVVTITLDAQAGYQITATETITATVPSAATTLNGGAIVAAPTFTVATITEAAGGARNMLLLGVG